MSFILDALRKSESERQRDTQPSVVRIPGAVEPARLPTWAAGTMTLLGLALLGLGAAWWLSARKAAVPEDIATRLPAAATAAAGLPQAESDAASSDAAPVPSAPPAAPAQGASAAPAPRQASMAASQAGRARHRVGAPSGQPQAQSRGAASPLAADTAGTRTSPSPESAPTASTATPPAASSGSSLLPSYSDSADQDPSLPKLRLEFHAFDTDPARRFVFINGQKYVEGDTLKEGPRLVRITAGGAVLAVNGRRMLLPRP